MQSPTMRAFLALVLAMGVLGGSGSASASPPTLNEARELHRAGELQKAGAAYREVLNDAALDEPSRAIANNNLCVVLDALGDLVSAEKACRRALQLRRGLGDELRLARTLNNSGLVLQHLGRYREAEQHFSEALAINRDLEQFLAQAINLANLGAVATLSGRFQEALERHGAVTALARQHDDQPWAATQLRIAQLNRGVVLERLGAYREGLEVYRALLDETPEESGEQRASILVNSGVIYRNLGDPVQAIERFEAAAAIYETLGDQSGMAHAELNSGVARYLNLNDAAGAESSFRKALSLVGHSGNRGLEIEVLGFLGRLLVSSHRADEAQPLFEQALTLARESGSAEGRWSAMAGLAETARARGDLEAALDHFEHAIDLIEEGRTEVARSDHRASFFADKRAVYGGALETLSALDRQDPGSFAGRALEVAQQAKSRDLFDALGPSPAKEVLQRANPEPQEDASQGLLMQPLDGTELASRLGNDVLVEFFVSATELLVWWTEAGAVRMESLGNPAPILDAVEVVHEALSHGSEPPPEVIEQLSVRLTSPWIGSLGSSARNTVNLWVAPDRRLRYLPFEILSVGGETSGRQATKQRVRLVERARISYLPSAWALMDTSKEAVPKRTEIDFLGFGGVDVSAGSDRPEWIKRLALEPLGEARRELHNVAQRIGGKSNILEGPEATEELFRANAGRASKVMHFATHTALTGRRGERTAILLTPGGTDDGLLSPTEIANTSIDSTLVVLAACTTALGDREDGRALTTLTGAFLAAGSQAVLATLWPVGDQPTAVFMDQFYFQLSKGRPAADALRRTKLKFMSEERWSNPALWSGYVLVGSAPPLKAGVPWLWFGVLALAALIGLAIWRARSAWTDSRSGLHR